MKRYALIAGLAVLAAPAMAADIQVNVTEVEAQQWNVVPTVLEQCMSSASLRGDTTACRNLYPFLLEFADRIKKAVPPTPAPTPMPTEPPK